MDRQREEHWQESARDAWRLICPLRNYTMGKGNQPMQCQRLGDEGQLTALGTRSESFLSLGVTNSGYHFQMNLFICKIGLIIIVPPSWFGRLRAGKLPGMQKIQVLAF